MKSVAGSKSDPPCKAGIQSDTDSLKDCGSDTSHCLNTPIFLTSRPILVDYVHADVGNLRRKESCDKRRSQSAIQISILEG